MVDFVGHQQQEQSETLTDKGRYLLMMDVVWLIEKILKHFPQILNVNRLSLLYGSRLHNRDLKCIQIQAFYSLPFPLKALGEQ